MALLFGGALLALYALIVPGAILELDGRNMIALTGSLVERGSVAIRPFGVATGVPGLYGELFSKYGPGQSLAAVPLYLVGRLLGGLVPAVYRPEAPIIAASFLPAVATALTVVFVIMAAARLGAAPRGALLIGAAFGVASPAFVYAGEWFSEPLTACGVAGAFYFLHCARHGSPARGSIALYGAAGILFAASVATRLDTLLFAPPLLLLALHVPRGRRGGRLGALALALFLIPLGVILVLIGLYNMARFGSPLQTGYGGGNVFDLRDAHPYRGIASSLAATRGLLVSPGKGLLEYAPVLVLAPFGFAVLWRTRRLEGCVIAGIFVLDLVGHADTLIRWVGGWSWGPRFLMPSLPLLFLLLSPLFAPRAILPCRGLRTLFWTFVASLVVLGVVIQVPAVVIHEPHAYMYTLEPRYCGSVPVARCSLAAQDRLESDYINRPEMSPILGSWRLLFSPSGWRSDALVSPRRVADRSVSVVPHTWWRLLLLQGVSPVALVLVIGLLLIVAVLLLLRALREADLLAGSLPSPV